jgi:hypothetical protein
VPAGLRGPARGVGPEREHGKSEKDKVSHAGSQSAVVVNPCVLSAGWVDGDVAVADVLALLRQSLLCESDCHFSVTSMATPSTAAVAQDAPSLISMVCGLPRPTTLAQDLCIYPHLGKHGMCLPKIGAKMTSRAPAPAPSSPSLLCALMVPAL